MSSRGSSRTLIVALAGVAVLAAWPGGAWAQAENAGESGGFAATFGFSQWSDVGDVQALSGGDFDDPVELDSNATLGGPVCTVQFGLAWIP